MNVVSSYIHALEGRLRIKIPEVKGASLKAREVEQHLQLLTGMEEVSANPLTGNVLILYNSRLLSTREIIAALKDLGYLEEAAPLNNEDGIMGKLTTSVASSLMELALTQLVTALI